MIRKIVIMVLTLAACMTTAVWVLSHLAWPDSFYWVSEPDARLMIFHGATRREWRVSYYTPGQDAFRRSNLLIKAGKGRMKIALSGVEDRTEGIPMTTYSALGFAVGRSSLPIMAPPGNPYARTYSTYSFLDCPLWGPAVLFAAYPAIAFYRGPLRRYRRRRSGLCVACGYDLTGNVSGRCPECATEIEQP